MPVDSGNRPVFFWLIKDQQQIHRLSLAPQQKVGAPEMRSDVDNPDGLIAKELSGKTRHAIKGVHQLGALSRIVGRIPSPCPCCYRGVGMASDELFETSTYEGRQCLRA